MWVVLSMFLLLLIIMVKFVCLFKLINLIKFFVGMLLSWCLVCCLMSILKFKVSKKVWRCCRVVVVVLWLGLLIKFMVLNGEFMLIVFKFL